MKKQKSGNQTIAAISTPAGEGGIAVIRISGSGALKAAERILPGAALKDRTATVCGLDTGSVKDEVVAIFFKAPRSFTGEDTVEIQCHGNFFLARRITESLIKLGCRAAEPGEFTRRAFLNGKIDLTKAEGILDLIQAQSEAELAAAYAQARGGIFTAVDALLKELVSAAASASAAIDYPEEDVEEPAKESVLKGAASVLRKLEGLIASFGGGALIREGVRVAITGLPNTGKSLLLNRLLGFGRAIVTDEAGTTRDTVEESFLYKGARFILTDTAGIRQAASEAEEKGIERSRAAVKEANLILAVSEADKKFDIAIPCDKPVIFVKNKKDLFPRLAKPAENGEAGPQKDIVYTSALKNEGIGELREKIYESTVGKISAKGAAINNQRHLTAVVKAAEALKRLRLAKNKSLDCMLSDINEACRALGGVTGVTASDEIVNEIFSKFCVGK